MAPAAKLSDRQQTIAEVAEQLRHCRDALTRYYVATDAAFAGQSPAGLRVELDERLREADRQAMLALLAATEAAFRIDYHIRCRRGLKDEVSAALRKVPVPRGGVKRLDWAAKILDVWSRWAEDAGRHDLKRAIGQLRGFTNYRNWLAHGRWYEPTDLPQREDTIEFEQLYNLVDTLLAEISLKVRTASST